MSKTTAKTEKKINVKTRYAIHCPSNRGGEFEFLTHNQSNWSSSLQKVREELEESIEERMLSYDPPLSRKEAVEELGIPRIYQLTVREVK